jgi:hypothetical protein
MRRAHDTVRDTCVEPLHKLIDELAKGKAMEKVKRQAG